MTVIACAGRAGARLNLIHGAGWQFQPISWTSVRRLVGPGVERDEACVPGGNENALGVCGPRRPAREAATGEAVATVPVEVKIWLVSPLDLARHRTEADDLIVSAAQIHRVAEDGCGLEARPLEGVLAERAAA